MSSAPTPCVGNDTPFLDALGVEVIRADQTGSELRLQLDVRHFNRWEVAHGGVTMTLLDAALALAARHAGEVERSLVTVEMTVTFMQPGRGALRALGRLLHRSTTMAFCEGEVLDAQGALVAKALGTFKYLRRLPVGRDVTTERHS
ncbi:MAG: PaaI family thioesterase [Janthinobacterium lividum]